MSNRNLPILLIETREVNGRVHIKKVTKFFESYDLSDPDTYKKRANEE